MPGMMGNLMDNLFETCQYQFNYWKAPALLHDNKLGIWVASCRLMALVDGCHGVNKCIQILLYLLVRRIAELREYQGLANHQQL
jgi:hypothetical protein